MSSTFSSSSGTISQRCQRCGMPLPPNEGYCKNCGQYNAAVSTNNDGNQASSQEGSLQQQGFEQTNAWQSGQSQASVPQNDPWTAPVAPQQSFRPSFGLSLPSQQSQQQLRSQSSPLSSPSPLAPSAGFQQSNTRQFQPGPIGFTQETSRPLAKKRGPRLGLIIGIIVLALVLIGGGIGRYFFLKGQGNSTSVRTSQSTSTPAPRGNPLFSDTFQNNNNGWDLTSKAQFSVKVGGGSMVLEDDNHRLFWETVPNNARFGDFSLYVDATLSKGSLANGYGVYIRGTSNSAGEIASYYRFELYGDGTYAIFKGISSSTKLTVLAGYTVNPAIQKQGHVNHLLITAHGSTLTFIVNGQTVKTLSDTSYTSGSIALFVSNLPDAPIGAQATFTKLSIYPAQS